MKLTPYKVGRMKKEQLFKVAEQYGLDVSADTKRPDLIEAIKAKLDSGPAVPKPAPREPGNKEQFLSLTSPALLPLPDGSEDAAAMDGRGGPRPGAGRKPGRTLEQSRLDNLSDEPNRTVKYALKWFFRFAAKIADCPEIALDEDELQEFAVDTTQFMEYHGWTIPQGLYIDGKFIGGGLELAAGRVAIFKAYKARLKKQMEAKKNEANTNETV